MTLQPRERRALAMLGVSLILGWIWHAFTADDKPIAVVEASESVPMAENRLAKLRQTAAALPGREQALNQVQAELFTREKGLIQAETSAQAQAQLLQIMTRIGKAQTPSINIKASEIGTAKPLDDNYGEVQVAVSFDCRIEQLVNLLADLTNQKELIATSEIRVANATAKEKIMPVRLTVSGVVRRDLIPDKKGMTNF